MEETVIKVEGKDYWLLDGPPYANAKPHVGSIRGVIIKDFLIKLAAMKGKKVLILPGFDTHGLPIENKVEKELGIKSKKEIVEKVGITEFMRRCREFATSNLSEWLEIYKKLGVWFGWRKPYLTLSKDYMNSVWWSFKELWKKGLIYEGEKPGYWCPHCQTVLSGYEVTDEYRELEDPSIFVKFKTERGNLLVWTTTPWTLIANVAAVVKGDEIYVKVRTKEHGDLILAKKRLEVLDRIGISYEVIEEFPGKELEGLTYEAPFPPLAEGIHKVVLSIPVMKKRVAAKIAVKKEVSEEGEVVEHFVNINEGTGIVHCAPGHGPEDFELGKHYNLPAISPIDDEGKFTTGPFKGMRVREANWKIVEWLKENGWLVHAEKIRHRYPVCWRCKTPLIFRLTKQWFLDVQKIKEKMIEEVKKVKWQPEFALERMINWISNAEDWTLSRQRFWNIPIPIWKCENGHILVVGSAEELERLSGKKVEDLHRNVVDNITFSCPECGAEMKRIPDVLDVWYDSGAAFFASYGFPHLNQEKLFPVDRIDEGQDQIRGWFYTLLVLGVALFNQAPYKHVSMHGWVVDEKGEKMSKSKGNVIWADQAVAELGPDILRFYVLWETAPWEVMRFSLTRAKKEVGRLYNVLKNIHRFIYEYAESEVENEKITPKKLEDLWILSRLNSTIRAFEEDVSSYRLNSAMKRIERFVIEDLSRIYMKLAKERLKKGDKDALKVLVEVHQKLARLIAPVMPFLAQEMWETYAKKSKKVEDVFLAGFPEAGEINLSLEEKFGKAMKAVEAVLAWRDEKKLGIRWPIAEVSVIGVDKEFFDIIKEFVNAKVVREGEGKELILDGEVKVYIDPELTPELIAEGYMREVARRVQVMRKELGLKPSEKVKVYIDGDAEIIEAVKKFENEFKVRVNATQVIYGEGEREWKIKGKSLKLGVVKV